MAKKPMAGAAQPSMQPTVTVIVPAYDDQRGVDRCLRALARQSHPGNVIVVDNASPEPVRLPQDLNLAARVVRCEKPGSYAARNRGIAEATGEILAFTDADCVPQEGWVSSLVAALVLAGRGVLTGGEVVVTASHKPTAVELYQAITGFMQRDNIEHRGYSVTASLAGYRRDFETIGPFDETLLSGGDREFSWRAAAKGISVRYVPEAVVETPSRRSLGAAIRQARRVAGGRMALRAGEQPKNPENLRPGRSALQSAAWILGHPELKRFDRVRVFFVASVIYGAQTLETLRLMLGGKPERR